MRKSKLEAERERNHTRNGSKTEYPLASEGEGLSRRPLTGPNAEMSWERARERFVTSQLRGAAKVNGSFACRGGSGRRREGRGSSGRIVTVVRDILSHKLEQDEVRRRKRTREVRKKRKKEKG